LGDRQSSHPVKTLLQHYGKSLEALPGVAYPGFRDNRSTLNTKTGFKKKHLNREWRFHAKSHELIGAVLACPPNWAQNPPLICTKHGLSLPGCQTKCDPYCGFSSADQQLPSFQPLSSSSNSRNILRAAHCFDRPTPLCPTNNLVSYMLPQYITIQWNPTYQSLTECSAHQAGLYFYKINKTNFQLYLINDYRFRLWRLCFLLRAFKISFNSVICEFASRKFITVIV